MLPPSGAQYEIAGGGYRAVVTECGGGLRLLEHDGVPLLDGFEQDEMAAGGRGQLLAPWPNRIGDGAYSFGGRTHQLPLSEPSRHNASHGLVRWAAWSVGQHTTRSVALTYRLMAQTGYPWTLDLRVGYHLSEAGLTVTQSVATRPRRRRRTPAGPTRTWRSTLARSTAGPSPCPPRPGCSSTTACCPPARRTSRRRRTTSGPLGRSVRPSSTTRSPTWSATPTAPRPCSSPTRRQDAASPCGSTRGTAGCSCSAPTRSRRPSGDPSRWSR